MYLFQIFRSFLPLHNPLGFGISDLLILALAILLSVLLLGKAYLGPAVEKISREPRTCMALLFALAIVLRLALLPQSPVPIPSGADDFSYVLLGDTLAHFRLANSAHPLHQFFESVFTLQQPTYSSIYPLGQGFVLAFGELIFRSQWSGVLLSSGIFCALCYWMLRAWVPPIFALAGGVLAIIQFGPLNPWVNSYWGGAVSASAGCLVFGSLPRLREAPRLRYGVLLGLGFALQLLTRPFESIFLAAAVAVYLLFAFRSKPMLAAAGITLAAVGLMLAQNKAVTQSWTTMPYMLSRYQYGVPTTFTFQANPVPHSDLTAEQALDYKAQTAIHDSSQSYWQRLAYRFRYLRFFLLVPLYFVFIPSLKQWPSLWLAGTIALFALGTNFYPYFYPQYIAALTCVFVLFAVQGLAKLPSQARTLVLLLCIAPFIFWYGLFAWGDTNLLPITAFQSWHYINRGDPQGRAAIERQLLSFSGEQLVFVRYSPLHRFEEWIHNAADIDAAPIVWANDLGPVENQKLLDYYPRRNAWLLEPDARPPALTPYPRESGPFLTVH
jgi:hypothetical protein